ncbi:MAG: nucleotidyltransferase domain-containing protein [Bacilli bacterium]|nr:nucleotidyltransferase domain-containing protein [Bacilli bacterium]
MSGKIYTLDEIKQNLKKILEGSEVNKVILFGSYAKNKATKKSDLDFIIDSKGKIMGFKLFSLITKIEDIFKKEVDAFEKSEIINGSEIDKDIQKTGVVVYEK